MTWIFLSMGVNLPHPGNRGRQALIVEDPGAHAVGGRPLESSRQRVADAGRD
jgi:hypothetical protein